MADFLKGFLSPLRRPVGFATLSRSIPQGTDKAGVQASENRGLPVLVSQPSTRLGTPVITAAGITKTYAGSSEPAVLDLSFAVNEGEVLAILGPSGCGKTTTLRLLAGFETPDSGEVRLRDRIVASSDAWVPPEKRGLGMVFQHVALFPHLTAQQNVVYGLMDLDRKEKLQRVEEMLDLVGMAGLEKRFPHQLSGGQQQRVALARALAPRPLVLLMDEPFGSLDADMRSQMRREVKALLTQLGTSTIIVTHDQEEAFLMADRILILHEGRLLQLNTPDNVYHRPATRFEARFVGMADFVPAEVSDGRVATELGEFPFGGGAPEEPLDLLVRPDDIEIEPDNAGQGIIVGREFKGADNLYSVKLPSGQIVRAVQPSGRIYPVGARVKVHARLTHVILFARES